MPPLAIDPSIILESMGDAFYALDPAWRVVYANRRALTFWKLQASELVGRVLWEALPQMLGTPNEALLRRAAAERRTLSFELPSPVTGAWVQVTIAPYETGVGVYWRDITERKQTEQTLRSSEEHLRLAQEAAGIGTWDWDIAGDRIHWSPQMFRLLGCEPFDGSAEALFAVWSERLHPDDRDAANANARAHSRNVRPFAQEFRIMRPDGETRWILSCGSVLPDEYGAPRRMLGVNMDITDRKRTEAALEQRVQERTRALQDTLAALQESRTRYAAVFEHAPVDLVFMRVLADGRLLCEDVNPAWTRHTGYTREQVVGRTLDGIFPPNQAALFESHFRRAIETGQPVEYEYSTEFPVGEVTRQAFQVPLRGTDGTVEHVLLTVLDLTETRRIEAQLRQAQKMEAIGQLTGGIAHDFNNLLTAVTGNLELLQRRTSDERGLRYIDTALRAAQRGGTLTQQLLAYARQQHLSPQPLDVNVILQGMQELLQRSLGGLVQVSLDLDPDVWPGRADPTQLESMVLNLAINARDAMPDGGLLRIATRNVADAPAGMAPELERGDYVVIAVIDTGSGMSRDVQERAFEPFFTTKEVGKGSGLGLAQVFGLARQFGGTVRLLSRVGHGTTVEIFLPRS
ncbi:MAG TPA: PAS domain S-box protein, partial [Acetobacteraceae bacterium]|nr:PAS domain S-box protein [Acetobacteraceae bacterium]